MCKGQKAVNCQAVEKVVSWQKKVKYHYININH
jgi:hypothetical protein